MPALKVIRRRRKVNFTGRPYGRFNKSRLRRPRTTWRSFMVDFHSILRNINGFRAGFENSSMALGTLNFVNLRSLNIGLNSLSRSHSLFSSAFAEMLYFILSNSTNVDSKNILSSLIPAHSSNPLLTTREPDTFLLPSRRTFYSNDPSFLLEVILSMFMTYSSP